MSTCGARVSRSDSLEPSPIPSDGFLIVLPWPARTMHPNNKPHRMVLAKARRTARHEGKMETMMVISPADRIGLRDAQSVAMSVSFHPPRRPGIMNIDGMIASMKSAIDGMADALGIDDSRFSIAWPETFSEPIKGGRVLVNVSTIPV